MFLRISLFLLSTPVRYAFGGGSRTSYLRFHELVAWVLIGYPHLVQVNALSIQTGSGYSAGNAVCCPCRKKGYYDFQGKMGMN